MTPGTGSLRDVGASITCLAISFPCPYRIACTWPPGPVAISGHRSPLLVYKGLYNVSSAVEAWIMRRISGILEIVIVFDIKTRGGGVMICDCSTTLARYTTPSWNFILLAQGDRVGQRNLLCSYCGLHYAHSPQCIDTSARNTFTMVRNTWVPINGSIRYAHDSVFPPLRMQFLVDRTALISNGSCVSYESSQ